jgi:O-Antigen ligase
MIFLICVTAFTISGDVFFELRVGGFTLRAYQFLLIPVLLKGMFEMFRGLWPVGFGKLLLWTMFILLFIPNTTLLTRNFYYGAWLVSSVLMVLGITAVVDTPQRLRTVLRWYTYSFAFSAAFGLVQFFMPLAGLPGPLVQEWWIPDRLARINGFTYEPSYFATYMITGWVLTDYLIMKKYHLPGLKFTFWLVTAALVLCTSRAGWMVMGLWLVIRAYWYLQTEPIPWKWIAIGLSAIVGAVLFVNVGMGVTWEDVEFLTTGMGVIDETGSFSAEGRWDHTMDTLNVYAHHPIIGVSLGGVAPEIARLDGYGVTDNDDVKSSEGLCTTAEVPAASGTFGFIFYVWYIYILCRCMFQLQTSETTIASALGWSLIMLMVILQLDQNILRGYLWLHIAILSAAHHMFSAPEAALAAHRAAPVLSPSAAVS